MADGALAPVIPLFEPRSCFECIHHQDRESPSEWGDHGLHSYCTVFEEQIDSEVYAAEDCEAYDPKDDDDD